MSRHQIYLESPGGGDRCWLGLLGQVSGLQWSQSWPGGPEKASCKFWRDARYNHRALTQGNRVGISLGPGRALNGRLARAGRGDPWELEFDGLAVMGNDYIADAPTSGNPFNLNESFDAATGRGLPWVRRVSLPTGFGDPSSSGGDVERVTVAAALSRVLPESGRSWRVDTDGTLVLDTLPTTVTHQLLTADPGGGRTVAGYVSALQVVFNNSATGKVGTVWVRNAAAEARRPDAVEQVLDVTSRGKMTSTVATQIGQAKLAVLGPQRTPWADSMRFAKGMIRNAYGTPVDPAAVRLPILARLLLIDPDHPAETNYSAITDLWVRRITYFDDTDTIDLEPLDLAGSDLKSLLGSASAPSADAGGSGARRSYGPQLRIHRSTNQNALTGQTLTVSFDAIDEDNTGGGMFTSGTTVNVLTDGWYSVVFSVEFAANATGFRQCHIFRSGVGVVGIDNKGAANGATTKVTAIYEGPLLAGQQLTFGALQNSGATLAVVANNNSPTVSVKHQGPIAA